MPVGIDEGAQRSTMAAMLKVGNAFHRILVMDADYWGKLFVTVAVELATLLTIEKGFGSSAPKGFGRILTLPGADLVIESIKISLVDDN
jgi:hypothetical protein